MINKFSNNKGFGLITVLVVILLASVALASMFVATVYAKYKVQENYHRRKALLVAHGKMDYCKYLNQKYHVYPTFNMSTFVLDKLGDGTEIRAEIWPTRTSHTDIVVSAYTWFDKITYTVNWNEPFVWGIDTMAKKNSVRIREDFYYKHMDGGADVEDE